MIKKAAAVKGELENKKAKVTACGQGALAEEILNIAKAHNITIKQDENLAEVLSTLELYEYIPDDMYEAVAEILQNLYFINKKLS